MRKPIEQHDNDTVKPSPQCVHVKRNGQFAGQRCRNTPILGATVCVSHGGNADHIRKAAAARMVESLPRVVERINEMLEDSADAHPCPFCKRGMPRDESTVLRAAQLICDRAGLGPTSKLELSQSNDDKWLEFCKPDEAELIGDIMARALDRMRDEGLAVGDSNGEAVH